MRVRDSIRVIGGMAQGGHFERSAFRGKALQGGTFDTSIVPNIRFGVKKL
jgi:hypothetical protein